MGQIFLNIDECASGKDIDEWSHLFEPDYNLLINPKVFPFEILQGQYIGDHVIHELELFDRTLTAENIAFSNSGNDSHTIHLAAGAYRKKNSQMTMGKTSREEGSAHDPENSGHSPRSNMTE